MLRITGILAILASTILAVALFGRVNTGRLSGIAHCEGSIAPASVALDKSSSLKYHAEPPPESPAFFPAYVTSGQVLLFFPQGKALQEHLIAQGEMDALITHRWLMLGAWRGPFEATEILCGGESYPQKRSFAEFFGILTLVSAAPLLLWLMAALPALLQRRSKPPASVA